MMMMIIINKYLINIKIERESEKKSLLENDNTDKTIIRK